MPTACRSATNVPALLRSALLAGTHFGRACIALAVADGVARTLGDFLVFLANVDQLLFLELLEVQEGIVCAAGASYELVELHLNGLGVAVLGILDQEDHEER